MPGDYRHYPFVKGDYPRGWIETTVGDVLLEIQSGFSSGKHNQTGRGIPHLRPMNVSSVGEISMDDVRHISPEVGSLRLSKNDVLFTNTSSTVWVGKTALVQNPGDWAFSNHMTRMRVPEGMSAEFVARQLHYLCISGYFAFHCKKHINQSSIARKQLAEEVPFRLPPANEQRRAISKLSQLLISERKLRHKLDALPTLIQEYRTAVLDAACTGVHQKIARQPDNPFIPPAAGSRRQFCNRRLGDVDADDGKVAIFEFPNVGTSIAARAFCAVGMGIGTNSPLECQLRIHIGNNPIIRRKKQELNTSYSWFSVAPHVG